MKMTWKGRKGLRKRWEQDRSSIGTTRERKELEQEQRQAGGAMKQHIAFSLGQNTPLVPSPQRGLQKPGKAGRKQGGLS